ERPEGRADQPTEDQDRQAKGHEEEGYTDQGAAEQAEGERSRPARPHRAPRRRMPALIATRVLSRAGIPGARPGTPTSASTAAPSRPCPRAKAAARCLAA